MKPFRILGTVALIGVAVTLSGCLIVPIPNSGLKVTNNWKKQAAKLEVARATREEVTRQLGPPIWDFPDLQVIGYRWSGVEFSMFWLIAGGYSAAGGIAEPNIDRLLWMNFDDQERLAHFKLTQLPAIETRTKWENARRWRESFNPPPPPTPKRFEPASPPSGKALVHVFWDKGKAASGVEGVKVDGQRAAEIRKGGFTTLVLEPGRHEFEMLSKPLALDLTAGEVCFLNFQPEKKAVSQGTALARCPGAEAVSRLKPLSFCK